MDLVKVKWLDAAFENAGQHAEQALAIKPIPRYNVGMLLHEDSEKVLLVFGVVDHGTPAEIVYDGVLVIPRGMVTEITRLKEA